MAMISMSSNELKSMAYSSYETLIINIKPWERHIYIQQVMAITNHLQQNKALSWSMLILKYTDTPLDNHCEHYGIIDHLFFNK